MSDSEASSSRLPSDGSHPTSPATSESSLSLTPAQEQASDLPSATSADQTESDTADLKARVDALPEEERQAKGKAFKEEGNKLFVAGKYDDAKHKYTEAIAFDSTVPAYWSNRAACELKLEQHGLAIEDASEFHFSLGFARIDLVTSCC